MVKLPEGWFTPPELELLAQCAREAPEEAWDETYRFIPEPNTLSDTEAARDD